MIEKNRERVKSLHNLLLFLDGFDGLLVDVVGVPEAPANLLNMTSVIFFLHSVFVA
jgi:hypothetical protein